MYTMQELINWNQQGLIPGPQESEADFLERACKAKVGVLELQPALEKTRSYFDVSPSWIPLTYSNVGLAPWHGGVMDPGEGLQLRSAFRKKGRYLGLYSKEEIVAHELVHAGRIAFDEPRFEELFAYQISSNPLRRWLGPIVERPSEVWAFLASILLPLMADYTCLAFGWWEGFRLVMPLKVLPGLLVGAGVWRNITKRRTLQRLLKQLEKITGCRRKARAVAYRLSDGEIIRFSKMEATEIRREIQASQGIRFEMIRTYLVL